LKFGVGKLLLTKQIRRTVKTGRVVTETIFSVSAAYVELYERRFGHTAIDKSVPTQRFEGFLFGFAPCCVDEYIRHHYTKTAWTLSSRRFYFTGPARIVKSHLCCYLPTNVHINSSPVAKEHARFIPTNKLLALTAGAKHNDR
jgi:hypothetical protein